MNNAIIDTNLLFAIVGALGAFLIWTGLTYREKKAEQTDLDRYRAANLAAGTLNILVTLQIHGSRRSVHSIVEYSGKLVNENTTPEPEIVPIFMNEGGRYGDLGPMLCGSCFAQKFEDAGMPEYTYTTQPLPGQSAEKGTADE